MEREIDATPPADDETDLAGGGEQSTTSETPSRTSRGTRAWSTRRRGAPLRATTLRDLLACSFHVASASAPEASRGAGRER
jgi:hypothetical protein